MDATKPFFQIAVGLIPTLLLGGLVAERFRRSTGSESDSVVGPGPWSAATSLVATLVFFMLPPFAEIVAIAGAIGASRDLSVWIVATTLVFGTYVLAAAVVEPWVRPLASFMLRHRDLLARRQKVEMIVYGLLAAVALLFSAGFYVTMLHSAVDRTRAQDDLARSRRTLVRARRALASTPSGEWPSLVRRIDATEHLVEVRQRVYRVRRLVADEALETLADMRLTAVRGSGRVPQDEYALLAKATRTFNGEVGRARRQRLRR